MSKVVKGGTIVTADRSYRGDVLIENGRIAKIGDNLTGDEVLDADGSYVMPGGIDPGFRTAADYATANHIKNWIADTALPTDDLSPKDAEWVTTQEFRNILLESSIEKFVLVPSLPETGADTSWIPDWQAATQAGIGEKIEVRVL